MGMAKMVQGPMTALCASFGYSRKASVRRTLERHTVGENVRAQVSFAWHVVFSAASGNREPTNPCLDAYDRYYVRQLCYCETQVGH